MQMARLLLRRLRAVAANLAGVAASRTALQVRWQGRGVPGSWFVAGLQAASAAVLRPTAAKGCGRLVVQSRRSSQ